MDARVSKIQLGTKSEDWSWKNKGIGYDSATVTRVSGLAGSCGDVEQTSSVGSIIEVAAARATSHTSAAVRPCPRVADRTAESAAFCIVIRTANV